MDSFSKGTLSQMHGNDNYYVYALIDPRNYQIFYIGKGKGQRVAAYAGRRENESSRNAYQAIG